MKKSLGRKNVISKKVSQVFLWLLIVLVVIFIVNVVIESIVHSRKEIVTPNIEGKSLMEALSIVSKSGLGLKKMGESFNASLPEGTIISQVPKGGMVIREGRFINVIVSLGGEKVFVPNIIGEDKRKAEVILRQYSLVVGSITENYSLRFQKNKVLQQNPIEGTIVNKGTFVDFVVSLGAPVEGSGVVLVPDFINKPVEEAIAWAQKSGLEVNVEYTLSGGEIEGSVISQRPEPDSIVSDEEKLFVMVLKKSSSSVISSDVKEPNFVYEVPLMGRSTKMVKIVQVSNSGEDVLYNQPTAPGKKISLYVSQRQNAKIRIFIDGVLIDEK